MVRAWAWVTAVLGLAVVVLTYIDGAILGVWADEHPEASQSLPGDLLPFVVAGIGVVLLVGGIVVGTHAPRRGTRGRD